MVFNLKFLTFALRSRSMGSWKPFLVLLICGVVSRMVGLHDKLPHIRAPRTPTPQHHNTQNIRTSQHQNTKTPEHLNISTSLLTMSDQSHIPSLDIIAPYFFQHDGQPYVFYIDPSDPQREKYAGIILSYNGIVHDNQAVLLGPNVVHLSSYPWQDRTTYLFEFIDQTVKKGALQFIENYRYAPLLLKKHEYDSSTLGSDSTREGKQKLGKQTTKFTPEADNYILEQVRMKPRFRTSHKFFEELSRHDMLKGHTGNSVRSRYRAHLEHKLDFVYKTDEYDNLVYDNVGKPVAIAISEAKTIKNKFTADEDYNLCKDIITHVQRTQDPDILRGDSQYPLDENKFSVLISFFDDYARKYPLHSSSSWRDRYRKFARSVGLQKYCIQYQSGLNSKEGPQPMSRQTSRKKAKDSLTSNSDVNAASSTNETDDAAAAAAAAAVEAVHKNGHLLGHPGQVADHHQMQQFELHQHQHLLQHLHHHVDHLTHDHLDANAAAVVANMAVNSRGVSTLDEEIGEVKNSNIHEALRNVGAEAGRVDIEDDMVSSIHPNLTGAGESDNEFDDIGLKMSDTQDPIKEMEYISTGATSEDLLLPRFYQQDPKKLLSRIFDFLRRLGPEDTEKVADNLERLGFSRKFVGHILRVTGAHAMYINGYLTHVFQCLESEDREEISKILFITGQNGFWTPEYDDALIKDNLNALSFMSEDSIVQRRIFLGLTE